VPFPESLGSGAVVVVEDVSVDVVAEESGAGSSAKATVALANERPVQATNESTSLRSMFPSILDQSQWRSKIDGIGAAGAITAPSGRRRNRRAYRSSAASLQIGRVVPLQRAAVAHTGTTGNSEPDRCSRLALVGRNGSARSRQLGRLRCAHKLRMLRVCPRRRRGGHPGQSEMRSRLGPARVAKEAEEKRLIQERQAEEAGKADAAHAQLEASQSEAPPYIADKFKRAFERGRSTWLNAQ
jgi:hypothetical protein